MSWRDRIELNPEVLVGKPVVKGTRLSVEHILDMLACGVSEAEILANHPRLTHEDILASVAYAAEIHPDGSSALASRAGALFDSRSMSQLAMAG